MKIIILIIAVLLIVFVAITIYSMCQITSEADKLWDEMLEELDIEIERAEHDSKRVSGTNKKT